jgi:DNA-binding NtrC family response regulator
MRFLVESASEEGLFSAAAQSNIRKRVARVLLADTALPSRLALKSILTTAGYAVSGAATAAEAMSKLDEGEYQLVLADLRAESENAGPGVLAYARQKDFRPATMLFESDMSEAVIPTLEEQPIHVSNEDVCNLLDRVASLISQRADRRGKRVS